MVRRIRPLAGRASLTVSVADILKLSLAPWNDAKSSAHALRTQRTSDTLGIALPTRFGFGITAGAGIHYPVLRRAHARSPSLGRTSAQDGNVFYCQAEAHCS